jgi:hypothetical protein
MKMAARDDLEEIARAVVDCGYQLVNLARASAERLEPVHGRQLPTCLRLMNLPLGLLLMNFGQPTFKDGLRRVANDCFPKR